MLRVNVLADAEFRADLLKLARGLLREVAMEAIRDYLRNDEWMSKRVEAYLQRNPIHAIVERVLAKTAWYEKPEVMSLIERKVDAAIKAMESNYARDNDAKLRIAVKHLVGEDLRARLGSG